MLDQEPKSGEITTGTKAKARGKGLLWNQGKGEGSAVAQDFSCPSPEHIQAQGPQLSSKWQESTMQQRTLICNVGMIIQISIKTCNLQLPKIFGLFLNP